MGAQGGLGGARSPPTTTWRVPHGHEVPLHDPGRRDGLVGGQLGRDPLHLGVRGRPRQAARPLRQGQEAAVGRGRAHRLVGRPRPRQPHGAGRPDGADLRVGHLEPPHRAGEGAGPPSPAGRVDLPVHARGAGGADRHLQDRPDRAGHRVEVLRGHPGHGRGPPRRGLRAPAPPEVPARLSDHSRTSGLPREHPHRPPLGHDLSRHADPHRGAGPGRLPAHPGHRQEPAGRRRQRLRHAGRGPPRGLRAAGPARLLSPAQRRRARRARGVRGRGLLPHAGPLQPARGLGQPRPARGGVHPVHHGVRHRCASSARGSSPGSSPP